MSINIIPLDSSHDADRPSVLVGKDILVKFKPKPSLLESNKSLYKLINSKDLILQINKLDKLIELGTLTDHIGRFLSESIRNRDRLHELLGSVEPETGQISQRNQSEIGWRTERLDYYRKTILGNSQKIKEIENDIKVYPAEDHREYFCSDCQAYLGPLDEDLPNQCQGCGAGTTDRLGQSEVIRYLSGEVRDYLQGLWLEDYIAKIFKKIGWKSWTSSMVMGSSGTDHQIDVLAIDTSMGKVTIVECKLGAEAGDPYKFAAQFSDIQPTFGLFIVIKELMNPAAKSFLAKKPGLKLLEIGGLTDLKIEEKIKTYVSGDN